MFPEKEDIPFKNEDRASITFQLKNFVMEALFVYKSRDYIQTKRKLQYYEISLKLVLDYRMHEE